MNTPHLHAAVIKAWADGAVVQGKYNGVWTDCTRTPMWNLDEYRIKPEITTSLPETVLYHIYRKGQDNPNTTGLRAVADAAIKQYIKEQQK